MEMLSFSSLCDAAIAKKRPILKGQATGCNLRRQAARTGISPFVAPFLADYCHLPAISMKLIGPDPNMKLQAAKLFADQCVVIHSRADFSASAISTLLME
jgi:hypothetical protein